jgi:hypothetical protein
MTGHNLYTNDLLDLKRLPGDSQADAFVRHGFADEVKKKQLQQWMAGKSCPENLNSLKGIFPGFEFIDKADTLPYWTEPRLMKAGSAFYARVQLPS